MAQEGPHPLENWISDLALGGTALEDIQRSIGESPDRIDRAYAELLQGYLVQPADLFASGSQNSANSPPEAEKVVVRNDGIPFLSLCVHHFLPFFGTVDVIYRPGDRLPGLGKISRLVACHAQRFQVQEWLVRDIAEDLIAFAEVRGVRVRASATHTCICYRGPKAVGTSNTTEYEAGELDGSPDPTV